MVNSIGECMPSHVQAPETNTIIPVRQLEINPLEGDTEDEDEEGREEVRCKVSAEICPPSSEETRRHDNTHLPFRNWCAHCVRGKSKSPPHRKTPSEEKGIPTVVIDYTFMTTADGAKR